MSSSRVRILTESSGVKDTILSIRVPPLLLRMGTSLTTSKQEHLFLLYPDSDSYQPSFFLFIIANKPRYKNGAYVIPAERLRIHKERSVVMKINEVIKDSV